MFTLIGSLILIFKELVLRFVRSEDFEFYRREFDLSNQFFNWFGVGSSDKEYPLINSKTPGTLRYRGFCIGEPDDVLLSLEIQPTIIGDKAFHCPVRNGKEWDRFSMVIRQRLCSNSTEFKRIFCFGKKRSTDHVHPWFRNSLPTFSQKSFTVIGSSCTSN